MGNELELTWERVKECLQSGEYELPDELANVLNNAHRFVVGERSIPERYADGSVEFRFHFLVQEIGGERSYYRAVVNKSILELGQVLPAVGMRERRAETGGERRQCERVMLVHVRQFGELPQEVKSALVLIELERLECPDAFQHLQRDRVQFLVRDGLFQEVMLGKCDGVLGSSRRSATVGDGQFMGEVIERGAHAVNSVTDDRGEAERWLFEDVKSEPWFAVARVAMGLQSVRAVVQVSPGFVVEQYQMLVGPPQLGDDSSERMKR